MNPHHLQIRRKAHTARIRIIRGECKVQIRIMLEIWKWENFHRRNKDGLRTKDGVFDITENSVSLIHKYQLHEEPEPWYTLSYPWGPGRV